MKQWTITFQFLTPKADIEKIKDLAEAMLNMASPDFGYFTAVKVTPPEERSQAMKSTKRMFPGTTSLAQNPL